MGYVKDRWIAAMQPTPNDWGRRWIPVSERLPEAQVAVLGFCCGEIGVCKRFSCGWYWDEEYSHQAINPTHWMPLPEPPEVK